MNADVEARLRLFQATLERWNARINLVSRGDVPHLWARHIADSLQLGALPAPLPPRGIDLGAGGGFPGLVLAIAYGIEMHLIEEDQRKCAFLREAARLTEAPVHVHAVRIEAAALPPAPVVTARALAPLDRLLAYAEGKLAPGGECRFLKGAGVEAELAAAGVGWEMTVERFPSATDPSGVILRLTGIRRRFGASGPAL